MTRPLLHWRARLFSVVLCSLGAAYGLTSVGPATGFLPVVPGPADSNTRDSPDQGPPTKKLRKSPELSSTLSADALQHREVSAPNFSRVVWMFYDKPIEQADPISRVCVSGWKLAIEEYNKTIAEDKHWQLLILSNESVKDYLTAEELKFLKTKSFLGLPKDGGLPKDIKGKNTWHSDLLRLRLLQIYGGMWVDASIFPFQIAEFGWIEKLLFKKDGENGPYDVIMKADNYIHNNSEFGDWEPGNVGASSGFEKARAKWAVSVDLEKGERIAPIPENHFIIAKRDAPLITAWLQRTEDFMLSLLEEWQSRGGDEDPRPLPEDQQPKYATELYGDGKKWQSQKPGEGLDDYQYRMAYFAFHAVLLDKYDELLARPQHSTSSSPGPAEQADFNPARAFSLLVLPTTGALPDHVRTPGPELSADVKEILDKEKKTLSEVATERVGKALGEVIMQKIPREPVVADAKGDALGVAQAVYRAGDLELACSMGHAEALGLLSGAEDQMLMTAWRRQFYHSRRGFTKFCGEIREIVYVIFGARMFGISPFSGKGKVGEFISSNYEAAVLAEFGSKEEWGRVMSEHLDLNGDKYRKNGGAPKYLVGLFVPESSSV